MSDKDEFLTRWMRLKQESTVAALSEKPATASDPATLPTIESITGESDIRLFLQSGVPADLLRTALRTAWAADPKIRDFIGIAESQWDFNDPNAMPGFGPLQAMTGAQNVVTRSVSSIDSAIQMSCPVEDAGPQRVGQVNKVWLSAGMENKNPGRIPMASQTPALPEASRQSEASPRSHGSALPKFT